MEEKTKKWLSHLQDSLPKEAYGYPISMYSIALEGWRRGLSVRFENNNRVKAVIKYSLSNGKKTHSFIGSRGDLVTNKAVNICGNKDLTKNYLSEAGVAIAEGEFFDKQVSDSLIVKYAKELGFPVVIKPITGAGGRGVLANIKNEKTFIDALNYVRNELNYKEIIVEKHFNGDDYRVLVIGNKVAGAVNRIPANVIGDGIRTISQLLEAKNLEKKNNPALTDSPIKKDKEMLTLLDSIGYSMDSVPQKGERVFLKSKSNISAGGEPIDATDIITDEIKNNAIKAVQAIPGLSQGGVDVLWDTTTNNIVVLEVNTIPSIRTHLFPFEGHARDVPKEIVDYYFPETKANHNNPLYYFDIGDIFKGFQNNTLLEITIPDYPKGNLKSLHFVIKNIEKPQTFKRKIFRSAKRHHLNGYVQNIDRKSLELVISGQEDKVDEFKNSFIADMKYEELKENKWEKPVKIGFEIINSDTHDKHNANSKKQYNKISKEYKTVKKEYDRAIKERDYYRDKYENIKNSKVWKAANILRKFKK